MRRQMQQMEEFSNNMFNSMLGGDPFGMFGHPAAHRQQMMLDNGSNHHRQMAPRHQRNDDVMLNPFGGFGFGGGLFGGIMQQMVGFSTISYNI